MLKSSKRTIQINKKKNIISIVIILIIAALGARLLLTSHAQSPYGSVSASTGTLSGLATKQTDVNASNGSYVQFGYKPTSALAVHVDGSQLINGQGKPIRILGVAASGTEDACILYNNKLAWMNLASSTDINQNAIDDDVYAKPMTTWHVNTVRVPLNEDCWLGINGFSYNGESAADSAISYQNAIEGWVKALNDEGLLVILDVHLAAPGTYPANQQWPMGDADHLPTFWTQVATALKSNPAIIYDPFNEPYMGDGAPTSSGTSSDWSCWLKGCSFTFNGTINGVANSSVPYQTAGMQSLVDKIRNTGATQPIMVGGLNWAGDPCGTRNSDGNGGKCSEIVNLPTDPLNQLAISFHTYNWTACRTTTCWDTVAQAAKAANLPIITGELGEHDCSYQYINNFMNWADANDVSYISWSWEVNYHTSCVAWASALLPGGGYLQLLSKYDGTPTTIDPEAMFIKSHLIQKNP